MDRREEVEWVQVINRRKFSGLRIKGNGLEVFTIFVDNLPDSMDAKELFRLFTNYGVATFILAKRRRKNGSRFGFLRHNCAVAAKMAVDKTNRMWVKEKALGVKEDEFGRSGRNEASLKDGEMKGKVFERKEPRWNDPKGKGLSSTIDGFQRKGGTQTFAEVVKGERREKLCQQVVNVREEGNGW